MHIPIYTAEGYEADDVIGTLAREGEQSGCRVLVVTGDLDELQLVSDRVSVMVTRRGITETTVYDPAAVRERYGFAPEQLPDFRALRGDTSDNIPGVPGIGDKTASALVARYGSLESVIAHRGEVTPARIAQALEAYADLARRSRELAVIVRDLPLDLDPAALRVRPPDGARLGELFRRLDFRSLLSRLESQPAEVSDEHLLVQQPPDVGKLAKQLAEARELIVYPLAALSPPLRAEMVGLCLAGGSAEKGKRAGRPRPLCWRRPGTCAPC